jgi:hypothetical protein
MNPLNGATIQRVRDNSGQSKRIVVANVEMKQYDLCAEIPAIFYTGDPHEGPFPPVAALIYDRSRDQLEEYGTADHPVRMEGETEVPIDLEARVHLPFACSVCHRSFTTNGRLRHHMLGCAGSTRCVGSHLRYIIVYVRPLERMNIHYSGCTAGKYIRDPSCYDVPSVQSDLRGCSSSARIMGGARTSTDAVSSDVCILFQGPEKVAVCRSGRGNAVRRLRLPHNENRTIFPLLNHARAFVRVLAESMGTGDVLCLQYPEAYWSHPNVQYRYNTLKPALSVLQEGSMRVLEGKEQDGILERFQAEGVVWIPQVFPEITCTSMDRVAVCIEDECRLSLRRRDPALVSADGSFRSATASQTYFELVDRGQRMDLIHPELRHFADFAPWMSAVRTILGTAATFMTGGLFRLYSDTAGDQVWHMDTAGTKEQTRRGPLSLLVVVSLTSMGKRHGPTEVLPMTEAARGASDHPGFLSVAHRQTLSSTRGRKMCLQRGDVMMMDSRTLHRGTKNVSGGPRDWLYFVYGVDDSTYLQELYNMGPLPLFYDY